MGIAGASGFLIIVCAFMTAGTSDLFVDWTTHSGIEFVLRNAATPEKHLIETMTGGVAVLDYDNDGRLDIYFVNGGRQPSLEKTDESYANRLYRNQGGGVFEDVTARAGVAGRGYHMGVAAADYDNDGFTDLFVTGVGQNLLYRNRGDGRFEDVTKTAGVNGTKWSVAAGWFDYDNDGLLDLFVVNYVQWDPQKEPACGDANRKVRTYCHPRLYEGLPNTLFHNNGDGTFRDVTEESGIGKSIGKGMSAAFADYNGDGRPDVFVTNDVVPNFLFVNEGKGRFREMGMQAGVALNDDGRALSSMGVDFRDLDNDGKPDIAITALANETFPLFRNSGRGFFTDVTYPSRIGALTMSFSGWSVGAFDFDNDGRKDLFATNGDVQDNTELFSSRKSRQANLLLLHQKDGTFAAQQVGAPALHRGAAFGDLDGDGIVDAVLTRLGDRPVILKNAMANGNHWIGFKLIGTRSNRDAIGAVVHLVTEGGEQWNQVTTAVGYASSSDKVVHFGLGRSKEVRFVEIRWPSGMIQRLENVQADHYLTVREADESQSN